MDESYLKEGEKHPVLGPHYFAAREAADKFIEAFEAEHFAPMIKEFSDKFYSTALETFQTYLLENAGSNLHSMMWHQIDESVKALLSGQKWALDRYALTERGYDMEGLRATVAKHIPAELQSARIADLEREVDRLKEQLRYR